MVNWGAIVMATIVCLVPGLFGQCVDCNKAWNTFCKTTKSGYFCMPGAIVHSLASNDEQSAARQPDKHSIFTSCTPHRLDVEYVGEWCCFWSESIGCQVGLHPKTYEYQNPQHYCQFCKSRCVCEKSAVLGNMQPRHWGYLGILTLLINSLV